MKKTLFRWMAFALIIFAFAGTSLGTRTVNVATKLAKVTGLAVADQDDDEIDLTWNRVSGASGYQVYRYDSTSKKWTLIQTTSKTYAEIENLSSAKKYKFKVRAYSSDNGSTVYGTRSDTLTAYTEPDEVKGVTAASTSSGSVTLTWKKTARTTSYQVYLYDSTKGKYVRKTTVSGTSTTINGLTSGTTCRFKIRAYKLGTDGVKYYGDFSDVCKVRVSGTTTSSSGNTSSEGNSGNNTAAADSGSYIGITKAKSIALTDAGVTESTVRDLEAEFDWEKGVAVYEVSFEYGNYEYDYEINAITGAILEKKVERD
ncbi:MAG: fibronectin type III domain-containing protein [Lachnospiraceae bacterium]|nr:fibronectin type III domain-containing protein [Lachnospiraceae bacterium]